jgi:cellobiose phosphorylase
MNTRTSHPVRIQSPSGLGVEMNFNGSLRRLDCRGLILNLFPGSELEGGPANIYLRRHGAAIDAVPLLGPRSPAVFSFGKSGFTARGEWRGIRFEVSLALAESAAAWFWHVVLENTAPAAQTVDLIHTQDLSLTEYWALRLNEYYVSQYVDFTPLRHPGRGAVLAVRQNQPVGGRHPWAVIGSLRNGVGFATDALQFHGLAVRAGETAASLAAGNLPGTRLQHEHALAAVQDERLCLQPGEIGQRGFFGGFEEDHPAATAEADLARVDRFLAMPEASIPRRTGGRAAEFAPSASLFSHAPLFDSLDLSEAELAGLFGGEWREPERSEDGRPLSFFYGTDRHVALKAKELAVLRPHGHILRTGRRLTPDEASLTSTVWMAGVFNAMVTQGHVSINRFLSTTRSYLSLSRCNGQRVFVELEDGYHLLDVPSAFEMSPGACRWIYKYRDGLFQVRNRADGDRHALNLSIDVLAGPPRRFLLSHHIALNGDDGADPLPVRWQRDAAGIAIRTLPDTDLGRRFPEGSFRIDPEPGTVIEDLGGDEKLFADGLSRSQPFLVIVTGRAASVGFRITGGLVAAEGEVEEQGRAERFWQDLAGLRGCAAPAGGPHAEDLACIREMLPWFAHNALIHYLAPRGLEQYSGGGWGTRDVAQGPVEMLLALGKTEPARDLLLRVFAAQNPDGDWPQWFMFFDRERNIRPADSHGDIVFWPVLATAEYLLASEDGAFLDETVPFFHPEGEARAEWATVRGHLERAFAVIAARRIPGTRLAAYGHGDWNDSLQPVDPAMRERLCSAWTVTLHHQTLTTLAKALRRLGDTRWAEDLAAAAEGVEADFQRLLIVDGILAGFAYFHPDGGIDYLVHPRDRDTGLRFSLLPMIHAIGAGLLTPAQAEAHVALIGEHLLGPDGARLFDRPPAYRGGPQVYFQRAESAAYFGREIGLMYTHAHLRYAEAMARLGRAEAFFRALRQACPIAVRKAVPSAARRQANCYYSSSDAAFADRYQASAEYGRIGAGAVPLEGGWRIYSSGAGIALRLIHECLLGLRRERSRLIIDPVLPPSLDGLRAEVELAGNRLHIVYRVGAAGHGPARLVLNGGDLPFSREPNPYRAGGVAVAMADLAGRLGSGDDELVIYLGQPQGDD